jgi:uncharacterized membrane protein YebE (DUF533 family)
MRNFRNVMQQAVGAVPMVTSVGAADGFIQAQPMPAEWVAEQVLPAAIDPASAGNQALGEVIEGGAAPAATITQAAGGLSTVAKVGVGVAAAAMVVGVAYKGYQWWQAPKASVTEQPQQQPQQQAVA